VSHRWVRYDREYCCSLAGVICSDLTASLEHSLLPLLCDNLNSLARRGEKGHAKFVCRL